MLQLPYISKIANIFTYGKCERLNNDIHLIGFNVQRINELLTIFTTNVIMLA